MFSPSHSLPFPFVDCFLCCREALYSMYFLKFFQSVFLFAFVAYAFSVISKKLLSRHMSRRFSPVFFQEFYGFEEGKLKFYITSFSCFCNLACPLQSLDHVGHVVSESGDLKYQELEFILLTLVLLFASLSPANLLNHASPGQTSPSPS